MDTAEFVYSCYLGILGREPNQDELQHWKSQLETGTKPHEVTAYFINSEEFQLKLLQSLGIQSADITNDADFMSLHERCKPFTLSSMYNLYALYKAVEYLVIGKIPGDIVECGVWKGGSSMLAALSLIHFGDKSRRLYLYDTYSGMSEPGDQDVRHDGARASELWLTSGTNNWWPAGLDEVRTNMLTTGYPEDRIIYVEGPVKDTIPGVAPNAIAFLRLDTDWYESTMHELKHLFPLLSRGGVVILDDYGWWAGCQKAANEYFQATKSAILLNRIDFGGARLGVKI